MEEGLGGRMNRILYEGGKGEGGVKREVELFTVASTHLPV